MFTSDIQRSSRNTIQRDILDECKSLLQKRMVGEARKKFITIDSLRAVWEKQLLLSLFDELGIAVDDANITLVLNKLLRILSVLIWIRCTEWDAFRIFYFDSKLVAQITDEDLPLSEEALGRLSFIEEDKREAFYEDQHRFCPVVIREGSDEEYDGLRRFPFILATTVTRRGAFGKVSTVKIPSGYLVDKTGQPMSSEHATEVACKSFLTPGAEDYYRLELQNLKLLSSISEPHQYIVQHLAAAKLENALFILFPRADMDLQEFLHLNTGVEVGLRPPLQQCLHLASALKFLHTELDVKRSDDADEEFMCHMDIKPENILVFDLTSSSLVGVWKLTDFGIAKLRPRSDDWRHTIETYTRQHAGPYQAPEACRREKIGRSADIWSLGCVYASVIAYGLGGTKGLEKLDRSRALEMDGKPYKNDYFHRNNDLNPQVRKWMESLSSSSKDINLKRLRALLLKMLSMAIVTRPAAAAVYDELKMILQEPHHHQNGPFQTLSGEGLEVGKRVADSDPKTYATHAINAARAHKGNLDTAPADLHGHRHAQQAVYSSLNLGYATNTPLVDPHKQQTLNRFRKNSDNLDTPSADPFIDRYALRRSPRPSRHDNQHEIHQSGSSNQRQGRRRGESPESSEYEHKPSVRRNHSPDGRSDQLHTYRTSLGRQESVGRRGESQDAPLYERRVTLRDSTEGVITPQTSLPSVDHSKENRSARQRAVEKFWIPTENIDLEILANYLKEYIDGEATIELSHHPNNPSKRGYTVTARNLLSTAGLRDLIEDSTQWEKEKASKSFRLEPYRYNESDVWFSRQRKGPSQRDTMSLRTQQRNTDPENYIPSVVSPTSEFRKTGQRQTTDRHYPGRRSPDQGDMISSRTQQRSTDSENYIRSMTSPISEVRRTGQRQTTDRHYRGESDPNDGYAEGVPSERKTHRNVLVTGDDDRSVTSRTRMDRDRR